MERPLSSVPEASQLLQLADLLNTTVRTIIDEWALEHTPATTTAPSTLGADPASSAVNSTRILPSQRLYEAQRTVAAITGKLTELISEPSARVIEIGCQYWESRALYVAAERRVPDLLAERGEMGVEELAERTEIEVRKLARILRSLCSIGFFQEIKPDRFANNRISAALVKNEPVRAYILLLLSWELGDFFVIALTPASASNMDLYTASDHLPAYLLGEKGASYRVDETAFQEALGTPKPRWDWLEEKLPLEALSAEGVGYPGLPSLRKTRKGQNGIAGEQTLVARPELETFGLAMLGGGKVFGAAHPYDYPWEELGEATVVDIGGGVGGFSLQLCGLYPKLKLVVQDRGPVLQQAKEVVWPKENPTALAEGRVSFVQHDFFQSNPARAAEVYWLRYILHDWSDESCIRILSAICSSMSSTLSRILICDQVMNSTLGCPELKPAPAPLPANYGYYTRYSHARDMAMMGIINGIERTPDQFRALAWAAGLRVTKIWECRSQVSIVEMRKTEPMGPV